MCDEHRVALELVENCRNAASIGSEACQGAIYELRKHWPNIMQHFQWEERELYPNLPPHQKRRLLSEHAAIRRDFARLTAAPAAVAAFATLLQNHVMWEETEIMYFAEQPGAVVKSQTIPGTMSANMGRTMSLGLEDEHADAFNIYNNFARPNPYGPVTPDAHLVQPLAGVGEGLAIGGAAIVAANVLGVASLIFTVTNAVNGRYGRAAAWFFGGGAASVAVAMVGGGMAISNMAKGAAALPTFSASIPLPMSPAQSTVELRANSAFAALPK
jgi:hypothetical protein